MNKRRRSDFKWNFSAMYSIQKVKSKTMPSKNNAEPKKKSIKWNVVSKLNANNIAELFDLMNFCSCLDCAKNKS